MLTIMPAVLRMILRTVGTVLEWQLPGTSIQSVNGTQIATAVDSISDGWELATVLCHVLCIADGRFSVL